MSSCTASAAAVSQPGLVFCRVLELAVARDPVRYRNLAASQLRLRYRLDRPGHADARLAWHGRPPARR